MAGTQRQHIADLRGPQPSFQLGVLAVDAVGDHRPEGHAGGAGLFDQLPGQLRLGGEARVGFPLGSRAAGR
jgi:hypothetical protein